MDKELALAIDFKKAPKDVQDAATAHYANMKALSKSKEKQNLAAIDMGNAQKAYDESAKALRMALKSWEPEV